MNPHARFVKLVVGAASLTFLASSPAWADQAQYTFCNLGDTGRTYWRLNEDVDEIVPYWGIWEHRDGGIAHSEVQYGQVSGPANVQIYGQGSNEWALYGVAVGDDAWSKKGTQCEGNAAAVERR